jgi:hypothetical protein
MAWLGTWNSVTDDPDGWVVANGQTRNVGDSRYSKIVSIVGSGSANSYTPPDYRGAFLRGAGTNPSKAGYAGATVGSSQNHATQTHSHDVYDPGHKHTSSYGYEDQALNYVPGSGGVRGYQQVYTSLNYTGIGIYNSTTNVHPDETRPYNYSVNWIIKL